MHIDISDVRHVSHLIWYIVTCILFAKCLSVCVGFDMRLELKVVFNRRQYFFRPRHISLFTNQTRYLVYPTIRLHCLGKKVNANITKFSEKSCTRHQVGFRRFFKQSHPVNLSWCILGVLWFPWSVQLGGECFKANGKIKMKCLTTWFTLNQWTD